jgi:hypothetical protein
MKLTVFIKADWQINLNKKLKVLHDKYCVAVVTHV